MNFKGKLIITDPCYITKDQDWDEPYEETLSSNGVTAISENTGIGDGSWNAYLTDYDPYQVVHEIQEWINENHPDESASEEEKDAYYDGFDEKVKSYVKDTLGGFCADAGMSCVAELDSLTTYNPDAPQWIKDHSWCVAELPEFDGEVDADSIYFPGSWDYDQLVFVGKGNYNFFTL